MRVATMVRRLVRAPTHLRVVDVTVYSHSGRPTWGCIPRGTRSRQASGSSTGSSAIRYTLAYHTMYVSMGFRRSTPPQNCQLDIWISNSEQSPTPGGFLSRLLGHPSCGRISPCSWRDCVRSLQSSYMGLYPQGYTLPAGFWVVYWVIRDPVHALISHNLFINWF